MRILSLVLCCCLIFSLVGCGSSAEEKPVLTAQEIAQESAETVSVAFVEALATGDYKMAASLTEATVGENSFVTAEDFEWYLPRSSFAVVKNLGFKTFKTEAKGSVDEAKAVYTVTLFDAAKDVKNPSKKSFTVNSVLNKDNKWLVSVPEFYCTNFLFRTSGGSTEVYIDGKKVPDEFCSNPATGPAELCKDYIIPYIGKNDVEVRIKSDNFDYTEKITPNSNNSISDSVSVFNPVKDSEKCFSYVKDTWNALCAKYLIGEKASCVQDYIAKNAAYDLCNTVWDGFDRIHVGKSSDGGYQNEKYKMTICKPSSKGDVYWISDTQILCYFSYELTWYYTFGKENCSTHQNSSVILSVENGVYKFYSFPDTGLFFEANQFSNEW